MPSRLGHGLYKKIVALKNIFRCIYIITVIVSRSRQHPTPQYRHIPDLLSNLYLIETAWQESIRAKAGSLINCIYKLLLYSFYRTCLIC